MFWPIPEGISSFLRYVTFSQHVGVESALRWLWATKALCAGVPLGVQWLSLRMSLKYLRMAIHHEKTSEKPYL